MRKKTDFLKKGRIKWEPLQYRPRIDCQRRSIDKKPPNPSGELGRKTERSRLGFFSSNPEPALPLQREFKQFNYYSYRAARWTVTFLEVPQDRIGLMFIRKEVIAFVGSRRIAGRITSCTAAILVLPRW